MNDKNDDVVKRSLESEMDSAINVPTEKYDLSRCTKCRIFNYPFDLIDGVCVDCNSDSMDHVMNVHSQIERVPTDWALAYNSIAPLVTKALAYFECGEEDKALGCIMDACSHIESVGGFSVKYNPE